jgi:hypothetical protein
LKFSLLPSPSSSSSRAYPSQHSPFINNNRSWKIDSRFVRRFLNSLLSVSLSLLLMCHHSSLVSLLSSPSSSLWFF